MNLTSKDDILKSLSKYFDKKEDIAFAFLYGSQAKGNSTRLSDVDVAVYFYPKQRHPIEFEEADYYNDNEDTIWGELESLLKKEVELLVLNRAPSIISTSALRGIPIVINDRGLYLDFMLTITDLAEDYAEFIISDYKERNRIGKRE